MTDNSGRLKSHATNCARGARNKQVTREEGSRATVANDKGPPSPQMSRQPSAISFIGGIQASRSEVRAGPILADIPAWAHQQTNEPMSREEVASHIAGRSRFGLPAIDPLITVGEAATILHVSTRTIRRLIERGKLQAVRVGRSVRIRPSDIMHVILGSSND